MISEQLECVFLAGAPADDNVMQRYGVQWRGDVPLGGRAMSTWVIDALRGSEKVGRIITIGAEHTGGDIVFPPEKTFLENMMAGVKACSGDLLMVCSSDIPLIKPEAIDDFVRQGVEKDADFAYPIISKDLCDRDYPQFKRTCLRLKEGVFTGGNAVLIRRDFALGIEPRLEELYQARKTPLKLAGMIGFGSLIRVILAQKVWSKAIDIASIEDAAGRVVGGKLRAVISQYPELGEDVDKLEDFALADQLLASHQSPIV